MTKIPRKRR